MHGTTMKSPYVFIAGMRLPAASDVNDWSPEQSLQWTHATSYSGRGHGSWHTEIHVGLLF